MASPETGPASASLSLQPSHFHCSLDSQVNLCPPFPHRPSRSELSRRRLLAPMRLAARRVSSLLPSPSLPLPALLAPALRARCWSTAAPVPAAVASPLHLVSQPRRAMSSASGNTGAEEGGPMQRVVHSKLTSTFSPTFLRIVNESHMHAVPRGSESHFKVTVVSAAFESLGLLARHRAVNACLADELAGGIHALSITARTPQQWEADQTVAKSPACLGGQTDGG